MATKPVIIAGGGIAGLAAALGLARIGRDSIVLEQASAPEAIGAGLQLGPNAIRALKWLGGWDEIASKTYAPRALVIRDGVNGKVLQRVAYGADFEKRFGEAYRVIHRADLAGALALAAAGCGTIDLRYGRRLAEFTDTGSGITAETQSGSEIAGEALIGADGVHSHIRALLLADGPARALPRTHYRALIGTATVPAEIESDSVCLWLRPGSHVVHYPIRDGSLINVVAAIDGKAAPDAGWSASASADEMTLYFADSTRPLSEFIAAASAWSCWPALDRPPVKTWSKGRTALIGDAAHACLPYLAQGAAMALEDAVVLARTIESETDIAAALAAYAGQRMERTARIATASAQLGPVYHAAGPVRIARNAAMGLLPGGRFLDRLAWIYTYDPAQR
jgi:salicylate hydroxylase